MNENTYLNKPIFIISLDTELIWGLVHETDHIAKKLIHQEIYSSHKIFDLLLYIFRKNCIKATWAVVGHLFLDKCDGHADLIAPDDHWYSVDPCTNINDAPLYYGKDIIEKILSDRIEHEIGYHTFSHTNFLSVNRDVAECEVKRGIKLAKEWGINLETFVFPKNEISHLDILIENGFKIYRGDNFRRNDPNQRLTIQKMNRFLDYLQPMPVEPSWKNGIWEIPTSMQFIDAERPFSLLFRAMLGLREAIVKKQVFHIYLHPYDLLIQPSLLNTLDKFLAVVSDRKAKDELEIMTMGDLASDLSNGFR